MRKTALYEKHVALGAKMVPFAGYEMPVRYGSEIEEHHAVRKSAGIFDVSHMGEFIVSGPNALDLIQKISSNDASKLYPGKVQYACMPNENGGIVDDLLVYMLKEEKYMLVVNASNIQKDWDWISNHNGHGAELENISEDISLLAVQGPNATNIIQKLTSLDLGSLSYYTFSKGNIGSVTDGAIISATGYTGSGGFEIYIYNRFADQAWDEIMQAGAEYDLKPAGLGARDTLRLEMGFALYGNDINDSTTPLEAGLGWITKFNKDFISSDLLQKQKTTGIQKKLVGFKMDERGIPRSGYDILNEDEKVIGRVTSGSMSPSLDGIGIGLGYVATPYANVDTSIWIGIRKRLIKATISKLPLLKV